jgi:hypothetical protein
MSVSITHYIVYGWKLPYDFIDKFDDKYLPYIEGHKDTEFGMICDGMNGDYIVFGKIIELPDKYSDNDFVDIDLSIMYIHNQTRLTLEYIKVFGKNPVVAPKLFSFIHYS